MDTFLLMDTYDHEIYWHHQITINVYKFSSFNIAIIKYNLYLQYKLSIHLQVVFLHNIW